MFEYTKLPSSSGSTDIEEYIKQRGIYYTARENGNEKELYNLLNVELTRLETATTLHEEELTSMEAKAQDIVMSAELREEILLRINWMIRLYDAQKKLSELRTVEEAKDLQSSISSVQTCPLKHRLFEELAMLVNVLPEESAQAEQNTFDQLMEYAIDRAGEEFINLGAAGRSQIVEELLAKNSCEPSAEEIQVAAREIEQQVEELHNEEQPKEMKRKLDDLPLILFSGLDEARKEKIVTKLLEGKTWRGLASLDRLIHQLNRMEEASEESDASIDGDATATTSLDVSKFGGLDIRY